METARHLENESRRGRSELDLERTPLGLPNKVYFSSMVQINKFTGFERPIRRRCTSTSYPSDIGLISSHSSSVKSGSSQSTTSGCSPSRNSPGLTSLSSQMSGLQSPSKYGSTTGTHNQILPPQQLFYDTGAIGGASSGVENDKMPSKTSPSKQRDHLSYTKSQSHTRQDFSHSATSLEDENSSHKNKRKKLKLNPKHDKDPLTLFCRDILNETTDKVKN